MQPASVAAPVGVRPARSLAVALLLGSAAVVALVCLTKGGSVASSSPSVAAVVFPLLGNDKGQQAPISSTRLPAGERVDRRSAIAASLGAAASSIAAPAWAKPNFGKKDAPKAEEAAPAPAEAAEEKPKEAEAPKKEEKPTEAPKKKGKADLSPYSKVDPNAFGSGRTMGKDFKTPKGGEGIKWNGPKQVNNGLAKGKADAGVPLNSKEDALALIKSTGARTFQDLAEGPQSGGGWYDHMEATKKQTERLYAERAQRRGA